jgi:toxin CptA
MNVQRIPVRSSLLIAIAVSTVHFAAAALLWLLPVPVTGQALSGVAIAASLIYYLARDAALHAASSIVALELRAGREISCLTRSGAWLDCVPLGTSYVSAWLTVIVLRARGSWSTRRVILVPDNIAAEDFRRLRAWLRWSNESGGERARAMDP